MKLAYLCVCSDGQLCLTLSDPIDCSLTGSSICGIFQAGMGSQPFPYPVDLPDPGIEPGSPVLQADSLPSEPTTVKHVWGFVVSCYCNGEE